jgi:hypothetical protein
MDCYYAKYLHAECRILCIVMLNAVMVNVVMLSVVAPFLHFIFTQVNDIFQKINFMRKQNLIE